MTSEAYRELGPTLPTSTAPRPPHPETLRIATELGLRYRPLATADQEDHQAGVLLLARDLDGADRSQLAAAAEQWARTERFMPKACDLLAIMREEAKGAQADLHALAAKYNAQSKHVHWFVQGNDLRFEARS